MARAAGAAQGRSRRACLPRRAWGSCAPRTSHSAPCARSASGQWTSCAPRSAASRPAVGGAASATR
eukprot:11280592-Alexandrium_andersonii.AAC.1